ncbi:AbrB/MazE/SpoVT family DNA-binding domain-containing protein [Brasilonema sp. UFV-L1]|uniref:AbrB/MazE/SpoVT family DNA-binding domain-containing protein n=1 Tax=Brasilonema sp. UFV-L1 TaxID=2234130 RepID=UPI002006DDED|nr:AbrB/MazE/SpoVT family DNA-binding domain-containing protein [Brasilonema sp. UFV-L1]
MTTIVTKWGNSLAVRIPRALVQQVQIQEGSDVSLSISGDSIVITPRKRKK